MSGSCPWLWKVLVSGMCSLELRSGGKLNKFRVWHNLNLLLLRGGWSWIPCIRNSQLRPVVSCRCLPFSLCWLELFLNLYSIQRSSLFFKILQPQTATVFVLGGWAVLDMKYFPVSCDGRWWTPAWLFILRIISSPSECHNSWQLCKALWLYHFPWSFQLCEIHRRTLKGKNTVSLSTKNVHSLCAQNIIQCSEHRIIWILSLCFI